MAETMVKKGGRTRPLRRRKSGGEGREHEAGRPSEISRQGWRDIAVRVKDQIGEDNISMVAGGVAFYAFLAIFPVLAAAISIYALAFDPATVERQLSQLAGIMPEQARAILDSQLGALAAQSGRSLSWGVIFGILLALWSANKGTKALVKGLDIAYGEKNQRGFIRENAIGLLFTLGAILVVLISATLVVAIPVAVSNLGLFPAAGPALEWLRWPVLALIVLLSLSALYHYGPSRESPRWRWVTWGSAAAAVLWLLGSWAFSFYVANFGNYNATYGSMGAVVILLLWLLLSGYAVLLGAEINAETEHETHGDGASEGDRAMG